VCGNVTDRSLPAITIRGDWNTRFRASHAPPRYACPFCAVVVGQETEWNEQTDVVFRDEMTTAFVSPKWWEAAPGNVLVVPNDHYENVYVIPDAPLAAVYRTAKAVAVALTSACGCEGTSLRQHNEPGGGQDVWHFHVHVFPRQSNDHLYERNGETRLPTLRERERLANNSVRLFPASLLASNPRAAPWASVRECHLATGGLPRCVDVLPAVRDPTRTR
jgi:histidine triad (HIT) family protein